MVTAGADSFDGNEPVPGMQETLTQSLRDAEPLALQAFLASPSLDEGMVSYYALACVALSGHDCAVYRDGADATPERATVQNLRRLWRDTYAVRAGASTWLRPALELFAGLGFETAATPDATLDPALPDARNLRTALGARVQATRGLHVAASFSALWYFARDNTGQSRLADAQPPTRRADAGGRYTLWLGLVNLGVEQRF